MAHVSAAERRPQLIKAAIDLMTREGVAAGSTRAIAAELGVAQATVHYTFGTKEDLYRAVMEQLTHDLIAQVERATPADAGFEETLTICTRTASWQVCHRTAATVKTTGSWVTIRTAIARACAMTKAAIDRMRPKCRAQRGPAPAPTSATTLETARTADTAEFDLAVC